MKKQILLSTGILVSGLLGAQINKNTVKSRIPARVANLTAVMYPRQVETGRVSVNQNQQPTNANRTSAFSSNVIGKTYYDLQTNSSVGDRIVVNADGSIAAVWTMALAAGDANYADRGTGYAYYNGTAWSAQPTAIVENARVGWGNIVNTRSGKESILSHHASGLNFASRSTKGTGTWANSTTAIPNVTASGTLWPRMVNSGDTIYSIAITTPVANSGTAYMGLDGAVLFSRSKDAGATWDIVNQIPAGLTSATFRGFNGDGYAIAAKGSTVVIVAGDPATDLVMTKSTNAGTTWTSKTIYKHPIPLWNTSTTSSDIDGDGTYDIIETTDGSLAVALDNNGNAFVAFGRMAISVETPSSTTRFTYYASTDGLYLWDESKPTIIGGKTIVGNIVAAIQDLGEQDTIKFPVVPSGVFPYGLTGNSLTSFPSLAFDASNTMYLSYSSIVDSLASLVNDLKLVRHVYVIKSSDAGATWSDPCDIVGSPQGNVYEGIFASMAKRVDGNVHIIYQRDFGPGNGIPGTTTTNPDQGDNSGINDIVYFKFPVGDIGACAVDVGIKEQSSVVSGFKFYPNPATTMGTLEINLNDNSKVDVNVLNAVGQVVYTTSVAGNAGANKIDLNLNNLSNGIYFYQIKAGSSKTITNKFIIAK